MLGSAQDPKPFARYFGSWVEPKMTGCFGRILFADEIVLIS